jgi:hypothetical protein
VLNLGELLMIFFLGNVEKLTKLPKRCSILG